MSDYIRDDAWYIKKGVEQADGWDWIGKTENYKDAVGHPSGHLYYFDSCPDETQLMLDALAAQLTRQVDELDFEIDVGRGEVYLYSTDSLVGLKCIEKVFGPDRTMNALRAIIDSGVLESD